MYVTFKAKSRLHGDAEIGVPSYYEMSYMFITWIPTNSYPIYQIKLLLIPRKSYFQGKQGAYFPPIVRLLNFFQPILSTLSCACFCRDYLGFCYAEYLFLKNFFFYQLLLTEMRK